MSKQVFHVGVVFGGRSSEHEVSLASARNVIDALQQAGHRVTPIGITPQGRWLTSGDPMLALTTRQAMLPAQAQPLNGHVAEQSAEESKDASDPWALLPRSDKNGALPGIDILFPVLHGPYGEDGTIQGLLEMANLPYVGCGVLSSAVSMDKAVTKTLFAAAGLPQIEHRLVLRNAWRQDPERVLDEIEAALPYPLFVKPANLGSSVGISKAHNYAQLARALDLAAHYDRKLLVEKAVPHAREIEVSVLGNDDPIASIPGEIVPGNEFYDYAAKYLDDNSALLIPAPMDATLSERLRQMAIDAFRAVDGSGLARVDFLVNGENNEIFLNEINTMPGFTRISMYPKLWEASGIPYPELVDRLLQLAFARYYDRQENQTTRDA
jgi:D-alanine-D-alanine ligase